MIDCWLVKSIASESEAIVCVVIVVKIDVFLFHDDCDWVEDGTSEVCGVWANEFAVGECGVVTRVEVVATTLSTNSVSTFWEVGFTRVSEVWSLGSEIGVSTITRWVAHDVGVVTGWVEVLED